MISISRWRNKHKAWRRDIHRPVSCAERTNPTERPIRPNHQRHRPGTASAGEETQKKPVHAPLHVRLHHEERRRGDSHPLENRRHGHFAFSRQGIQVHPLGDDQGDQEPGNGQEFPVRRGTGRPHN